MSDNFISRISLKSYNYIQIRFNLTKNLINDILSYKIIFAPNIDNQHEHPDYGTSCWACDNLYYKYGRKNVHIFEHTNVICDLFAYGSQESMKKYCDLYNNYDELNDSFFNDNLKQYQTITDNIKYENGNYNLKDHNGHIDSLYYYNLKYSFQNQIQELQLNSIQLYSVFFVLSPFLIVSY
jgi:hypothetical protein